MLFFGLTACQFPLKIDAKKTSPIQVEKEKKIEEIHTVVLAFVGDVIVHEKLRLREEKTHEGYQIIWSNIQNYLSSADFTYANLEGPVAEEYGGVSGFPMFNFPEKIISSLKDSGFDLVSTANNHALDRQASGVRKTIQNLQKYNLGYTGTLTNAIAFDLNQETWWHLTPFESKSIAWVSCTEMTNGMRDKEGQVLYCFKDIPKMKEIILQLKNDKKVAAIILLPHWGEEEKYEIESYRRRWAHIMLDLGATAVIGSHPHVSQKIEMHLTPDKRKTLIAYSLGNFISNQPAVPTKTSMLLYLKLKPVRDSFVFDDVKYIPLWMNRKIEKDFTARFRLEPAFDMKRYPKEAVQIWHEQLGEEGRLKSPIEVENFLKK